LKRKVLFLSLIAVLVVGVYALANVQDTTKIAVAAQTDNPTVENTNSATDVAPIPVNLASQWNLAARNMDFTSLPTPASAKADTIISVAREAMGEEGKKATVAGIEYGMLTDKATPQIGGIAMNDRPVWLVSFNGISIPAVNGYIFTKALVVVDAETGQWIEMIQ